MKLAIAILALVLSGCAACREHPTACAVVAWTAATCVALSVRSGHREQVYPMSAPLTYPGAKPVNCQQVDCH